MPQYCAVRGCHEKGGHKFPSEKRNKDLLQLWLKAIRRTDYNPPYFARVCKKHFKPDDYEMPKDSFADIPNPKLKLNTVPSQFAWNQESEEKLELRPKCPKIALQYQNKEETATPVSCIQVTAESCPATRDLAPQQALRSPVAHDTKETFVEIPIRNLRPRVVLSRIPLKQDSEEKKDKRKCPEKTLQHQSNEEKSTAVSCMPLKVESRPATRNLASQQVSSAPVPHLPKKSFAKIPIPKLRQRVVLSPFPLKKVSEAKGKVRKKHPETALQHNKNKEATATPVYYVKVNKVKRYYNFDEVGEDVNVNSMLSIEM